MAPAGETIQYLMIFTGDTIRFSVALLGGVLFGAFASALVGRRFRSDRLHRGEFSGPVSGRRPADGLRRRDGTWLFTVGQGLSGLSTASLSSVIAVAGYCCRRVWHDAHQGHPVLIAATARLKQSWVQTNS